jgi:hypothetical protein
MRIRAENDTNGSILNPRAAGRTKIIIAKLIISAIAMIFFLLPPDALVTDSKNNLY